MKTSVWTCLLMVMSGLSLHAVERFFPSCALSVSCVSLPFSLSLLALSPRASHSSSVMTFCRLIISISLEMCNTNWTLDLPPQFAKCSRTATFIVFLWLLVFTSFYLALQVASHSYLSAPSRFYAHGRKDRSPAAASTTTCPPPAVRWELLQFCLIPVRGCFSLVVSLITTSGTVLKCTVSLSPSITARHWIP